MNKFARVKLAVLSGLLSVVGLVYGGNVCTWTGNGSDSKWSTEANWDTPPQSGNRDVLVLEDAGTTENDIADLAVKAIRFTGTQAAVLTGQQIVFDDSGSAMSSNFIYSVVNLTVSTPLKVADGISGNISSSTQPAIFNGAITLGTGAILKIGTSGSSATSAPRLDFNGPIVGENARVVLSHGVNGNISVPPGVWFNDVVQVKELSVSIVYGGNYLNLCRAGNTWLKSSVQAASIRAQGENVFGRDAVLTWWDKTLNNGGNYPYGWMPDDSDASEVFNGCYNLNGYDQTIDRIASEKEPIDWNKGWHNTFSVWSKKAATLTMKATGAGMCHGRINGALTLVWDPQGADGSGKKYDLTFVKRIHKTTGDIVVKGGRVLTSGACTFKNLNAIDVRKEAGFVLDTTEANALENLKKLSLQANATFEVTSAAATPFGSGDGPKLQMSSEAGLVIPQGVTLNVSELLLDGERINSVTYQSGTVPWITGGGMLTVAAANPPTGVKVWKSARSGAWDTAANWLGGVAPGASDAVEVAVPYEGSYAAQVNGDLAYDGDLTVANDLGGTATVEVVSGTWTRGGTNLVLKTGGAIAVDSGATLAFAENYTGVKVAGGNVIVKDGATVNMNVTPGASTSVSAGGVVRVESGGDLTYKCSAVDGMTSRCFDIGTGGRLEVAGHAYFRSAAYWGHALYLSGGDVEATGNGALDIRVASQGGIFGNGTVTMKDSSTLYITNDAQRAQIPTSRDKVYERTTITFADHARLVAKSYLLLGNNRLNDVTNPRNEATLNFNSDATSTFANSVYLGIPNGLATLNQSSGTLSMSGSLNAGACYALSPDIMPYWYWASTTLRPEGRLNVSGGTLSIVGSTWDVMSYTEQGKTLYGLILGNGVTLPSSANPYAGDYAATGSLNLSAGTVTIGVYGNLLVGAGFGSGSIDQTGGTLQVACTKYGAVVGFMGATGAYTFGGGTATLGSDLFVGGVSKSEIGWNNLVATGTRYNKAAVDAATRHDAVGTLTVTGGTMTVAKKLVLSADGTGTLNVGEGGSLTAANIELRDGTATGGGLSSVNFTFGPTGSGVIETTGTLTVAPGVKLTVDARNYTGSQKVRFLKFGELSGSFAAQDVTFLPPTGRNSKLLFDEHGVTMTSGCGLLIFVK